MLFPVRRGKKPLQPSPINRLRRFSLLALLIFILVLMPILLFKLYADPASLHKMIRGSGKAKPSGPTYK